MPLPAEDVLRQLVAATAEAKTTIRELHEARATALDIDKKHRERITQTIVTEVEKQVGQLRADAYNEMIESVSQIIEGLAVSWRTKLGLSE